MDFIDVLCKLGIGAGLFATRRYSEGTVIKSDGVRLAAKALLYATALNAVFGAGITFGIAKALDVHSVRNLFIIFV